MSVTKSPATSISKVAFSPPVPLAVIPVYEPVVPDLPTASLENPSITPVSPPIWVPSIVNVSLLKYNLPSVFPLTPVTVPPETSTSNVALTPCPFVIPVKLVYIVSVAPVPAEV